MPNAQLELSPVAMEPATPLMGHPAAIVRRGATDRHIYYVRMTAQSA